MSDSSKLVATGLRAGGQYVNELIDYARQGRRTLLIPSLQVSDYFKTFEKHYKYLVFQV